MSNSIIYDELKIVLQLMTEINLGVSVKLNGITYTNADGTPFVNTANIQAVVANAFDASNNLYILKPSLNPNVGTLTIEDYLISIGHYNFTQTSPASNNLYLGDNVVIDSVNQHVDFGLSSLTKVKDAVNPTDVPAYGQIINVRENLKGRIDNVDLSLNSIKNDINNILAGAAIKSFQKLREYIDDIEATDMSDDVLQFAKVFEKIDDEEKRADGIERQLFLDLSGEIGRAKEAESTLNTNIVTEKTRATGAEDILSGNITSEVIRATKAENLLTSKQVTSINVLSTPSFYTDGDKPMHIPPSVYSYIDGFYYKNMYDADSLPDPYHNKINWHIPQVFTFSQINCFSFNINVLSNKQLPFVTIYKKTASGIDFNNKQVYKISNPETITVNAEGITYLPYQFYVDLCGNNLNTLINYGFVRKPLSLFSLNPHVTETINPSDNVIIVLQTDSNINAYDEEFVIGSFCVGTLNQTFEYKFSTDQLSLSYEISRATAKEGLIDGSLNNIFNKEAYDISMVTGFIEDVSGELIRVDKKLDDEIKRATNKETVIDKQITSFLGSGVSFDVCGNYIKDLSHPTFIDFYHTQADPNYSENYNSTRDKRLELLTGYIKQLEISHINLNKYLFGPNALPHKPIDDLNPDGPATTATVYPYNPALRP